MYQWITMLKKLLEFMIRTINLLLLSEMNMAARRDNRNAGRFD